MVIGDGEKEFDGDMPVTFFQLWLAFYLAWLDAATQRDNQPEKVKITLYDIYERPLMAAKGCEILKFEKRA